jgi:hypothetical protein
MPDGQIPQKKPDACAFVIFGVTGDLAHRLVVPSLYNLAAAHLLPDKFCVVGVARNGMSNDELRDGLMKGLRPGIPAATGCFIWRRPRALSRRLPARSAASAC